MPVRLSPTTPQRHPRSRSSSPTRRVVVRSSPTSASPRIRVLHNGHPVSPITPGSQGSQRGRPAHDIPERLRSPSSQRIITRSPDRSPGRLYAPRADDGGGGSSSRSQPVPGGAALRQLRSSSRPDGGGGGSLLDTVPGARVVDRKQREREVSRAVVVTTELYDVRHPPPLVHSAAERCHVAA